MEIKEFTLDCARMTDRAAAHEYLAEIGRAHV